MSKKKGTQAPKNKRSDDRKTTKKSKESSKLSIWYFIGIIAAVLIGVALSKDHGDPSPEGVSYRADHEQADPVKSDPVEGEYANPMNSDAATINKNHDGKKKAKLSDVFQMACITTGLATCGLGDLIFDDELRTVRASQKISRQTPLIRIAPDMQLTSLKALRDPRLKRFIDASPTDDLTGALPSGTTYLAIYLIMEIKRLRALPGNSEDWSPLDRVHSVWYDYLPTMEDFAMFHPSVQKMLEVKDDFLNGVELEKSFPPFSSFMDQNIDNRAHSVLYSYKSWSGAIDDFDDIMSFEEFAWASWIVNTRAFGRTVDDRDNISESEIEELLPHVFENRKDQLGVTMMPLIDALNDVPNVNSRWNYNYIGSDDPLEVTLYSLKTIEKGSELFVSYGSGKTDFRKFGQYGYANTDGTEISLATIAPYHRPSFVVPIVEEDKYEKFRQERLTRYLNFGDGYEECPEPDVEEGMVERAPGKDDKLFQYARYKALLSIFRKTEFWYVVMPTGPGQKLTISNEVLTTCRILAMTHRDYDFLAMPLLGKYAGDDKFETLRSSKDESLDYRTYHVLERLATETVFELRAELSKMIEVDDSDGEKLPIELVAKITLASNELPRTSLKGMRAFILMRELESLQEVIDLAQDKKKRYLANKQKKLDDGEEVNEEDYIVRMTQCPRAPVPFDWTPYVTSS